MIYTSTSCLKNPKNVLKVLKEYEKADIENVELGSIHSFFNVKELKKFSFNFMIHNYFPPPKKSFIFNLASQNKKILRKSIETAKRAIDLCCETESPIYSFHAGFRVDPSHLAKPFERNNVVNRKTATSTFVKSVREIVTYSKSRGIKLAMEPNVVQKFNLINGKNNLLLFADYKEIHLLFKHFKKKEIGLLLDLGHTSVTSHWLKYDRDEFVRLCKDKVVAVHISNNNGYSDQHKALTRNCWQVSKLNYFKQIPIVLEAMNLDIKQIKSNIRMIRNVIK